MWCLNTLGSHSQPALPAVKPPPALAKDRSAPWDVPTGFGAAAGAGRDAAGAGRDAAGAGRDAAEHPLAFSPRAGRAAFGTVRHRELDASSSRPGQPAHGWAPTSSETTGQRPLCAPCSLDFGFGDLCRVRAASSHGSFWPHTVLAALSPVIGIASHTGTTAAALPDRRSPALTRQELPASFPGPQGSAFARSTGSTRPQHPPCSPALAAPSRGVPGLRPSTPHAADAQHSSEEEISAFTYLQARLGRRNFSLKHSSSLFSSRALMKSLLCLKAAAGGRELSRALAATARR